MSEQLYDCGRRGADGGQDCVSEDQIACLRWFVVCGVWLSSWQMQRRAVDGRTVQVLAAERQAAI